MNADDRPNRSDDVNPRGDSESSLGGAESVDRPGNAEGQSRVDEIWAQCLRSLDAGQIPDVSRLAEGDQQLLDELRELLETSSWLSECIETEATTLRPQSRDEDEDTQPFIIERSNDRSVGSLAEIIRRVSEGEDYPFGEYELLDIIGRGGMGVVFRGRQKAIGREVAIKMIAAGRFASRSDIERFYSEARAASAVKHTNIVTIYQVGEIDGHHFYSMDFISGSDLSQRIRGGTVPPREAAELMRQVARAVESAHMLGVVHRDLKPGNILIDDDGDAHVTDFGLAKLLGQEGDLTNTGNAMGTPGYMPPEQATGCWHAVGESSDVYSMGAILFAALTGRAPFKADNPLETTWSVVHEPPPRPTSLNDRCDVEIETIALKCLEKDPLRRYSSASELADDLEHYLAGEPLNAKPISRSRRIRIWCVGIPIVAALSGNAVCEPTQAQQRAQAGFMLAAMGLLVWLTILWGGSGYRPMPKEIRITGGIEGGMYTPFARDLKEALEAHLELPVNVRESAGSADNEQQIRSNLVDLALVQASAVDGNHDAIVAPVFYEYVHVIVRKELGAKTFKDLDGRKVSLGAAKTGSRLTSNELVDYYNIETDPEFRDLPFADLLSNASLDAAIVTVGLDNNGIRTLIETRDFDILALPNAKLSFSYRSAPFPKEAYEGKLENTLTLETPAFLVTHVNASPELVRGTLEALYQSKRLKPFAPEKAVRLGMLRWHETAIEFFKESVAN
jgi:eukaryotic-like serine/threonine-protein kinase